MSRNFKVLTTIKIKILSPNPRRDLISPLDLQKLTQITFPDAGRGVPEVIVLEPNGQKNNVPVKLRQLAPDNWRCEYVPTLTGLYSVNVFFAGQPIPGSPFGVRVSPGQYFNVNKYLRLDYN